MKIWIVCLLLLILPVICTGEIKLLDIQLLDLQLLEMKETILKMFKHLDKDLVNNEITILFSQKPMNYERLADLLRREGIPEDRIQILIEYMEGLIKADPKIDTTFIIWKGYKNRWRDLLVDPIPPVDENSFIAVNDLKLGYETLYDKYFNTHIGKTKIVWNWTIVGDSFIRSEIIKFVTRYKDKIHSHMVGGDTFNSFDWNPPYDRFFECIRQNIALVYASDINAVIELCVAYPESVNGTIWLNTILPYLDIQGLGVFGWNKKTQDQRLTLTIAKEKLDRIAPDKYKVLIGQFTGVDLERAKIAEELKFYGIQFMDDLL